MFWGPKHLLSNAVLRAIGRDSVVGWRVFLDAFFKATCAHLEKLSREVVDERSALAAVDFSRYLQNSGAVELLTRYRDASQDFSRVRTLISDLAEQAGPWLRGSRVPAKAPSVELGEVHEKAGGDSGGGRAPCAFPSTNPVADNNRQHWVRRNQPTQAGAFSGFQLKWELPSTLIWSLRASSTTVFSGIRQVPGTSCDVNPVCRYVSVDLGNLCRPQTHKQVFQIVEHAVGNCPAAKRKSLKQELQAS